MFFKFIKFSGSGLKEMALYTVCGTLATIADSSFLFALERWSDLNYLFSAFLAFLLGAGVSYVLSIRWAFKNYYRRELNKEKFLYFCIMFFGLVLNELIIYAFGENELAQAKLLSIVVVTIWNFMAKKLILFNRPMLTKTAWKSGFLFFNKLRAPLP